MCTERILNSFLSLAEKYPKTFNHPKAQQEIVNNLSISLRKIDLNNPDRLAKISLFVRLHFVLRVVESAFKYGFAGYLAEQLIGRVVEINGLLLMQHGASFGSTLAVAKYSAPYLNAYAQIQAKLPDLSQKTNPGMPEKGYRPRIQTRVVT